MCVRLTNVKLTLISYCLRLFIICLFVCHFTSPCLCVVRVVVVVLVFARIRAIVICRWCACVCVCGRLFVCQCVIQNTQLAKHLVNITHMCCRHNGWIAMERGVFI